MTSKNIVYSIIAILFTSFTAFGQQSVMQMPGKYVMPFDNNSKVDLGSGLPDGDAWLVFSDRNNNPVYTDRSCTSPSGRVMNFMQAMYVLKETTDAIKIVSEKDVDRRGTLADGAESRSGWVKKESMLLWNTCLKTRDVNLPGFKDGVFNKKAMVLNIISDQSSKIRVPEYYSNPSCNSSDSINSALVYQINYVYKETDKAYLLGEVPELTLNDVGKVKGWVLKSQTTAWNHRLAYEINWDKEAVAERKAKGVKVKVHANKSLSGGVLSSEGSGFYEKRAIGEIDRYPVLDVYNGVAKVGVIGDLKSEGGKTLSHEEFASIKHDIDSMSTSLRNVNVLFVVNANSGMLPYSKAIKNAITGAMRKLSVLNNSNNYKFGLVLYRDASEGRSNATNYSRDLNSNYRYIESILSKFMIPSLNRCNPDLNEAVYYGIDKAIERFNPPAGESNFLVLIGNTGNHNRTTYKDCNGVEKEDFTNISEDELINKLAAKNINLLAYQLKHEVTADKKQAYEDYRTQVKRILQKTAEKRIVEAGNSVSGNLLKPAGQRKFEIDPMYGIPGVVNIAPDGGVIHQNVFAKNLEEGLIYINEKVNDNLNNIAEYLNGKVNSDNLPQLSYFIHRLEENDVDAEQLEIIFEKSGQVYKTGYAQRYMDGLDHPLFQDVLLVSRNNLRSIKRALELLIPTDQFSYPPNESRSYIIYNWNEILVNILGYFPKHDESIDTLSLYTLSSILTGWGGKEKYKNIQLKDVTNTNTFTDEMLFEYLIDWCITKGHIQSIFDGQNLLNGDFFEDHQWTIFYEYLFQRTNNTVAEAPELKVTFDNYFKKYNDEYDGYNATFRIPIGTGSGKQYYWIDSRIFPHDTEALNKENVIEYLYKGY